MDINANGYKRIYTDWVSHNSVHHDDSHETLASK